jgi:hypothetical protein
MGRKDGKALTSPQLKLLVERILYGDVRDTEETRHQATVERPRTFRKVYSLGGV